MSAAALEEGHYGFGLQERDWWRRLQPWSTGAKANAKRLIALVLVMQFAMPLMPTLWKSAKTSFAGHEDFVASLPNCSFECHECDDSPLLTKLTRPDFVSNFPFRSSHLFYEVEEGAYGERICTRRKPFFTGEYALRDSCPAELEIRDRESCERVARRILPSGANTSRIDIQWHTQYWRGSDGGCLAMTRSWDSYLDEWGSWDSSGLRWCFVLPQLPTQALVLAIAFAAAWLIARLSQEQASPANEQEDDDTALRKLVAEGSGRMAMATELGFFRKTCGLLFRIQQVLIFMSCFLMPMLTWRPEEVIFFAVLIALPFFIMYGIEEFIKHPPTSLIAPLTFNIFNVGNLSLSTRFHVCYLPFLNLAVVIECAPLVLSSFLEGYPYSFANRLAQTSLEFQGHTAQGVVMCWGGLSACSAVAYLYTITVMLLFGASIFSAPSPCRLISLLLLTPLLNTILGPFLVMERWGWLLCGLFDVRGRCGAIARMRQGAAGFPLSSRISTHLDSCFGVGASAKDIFAKARSLALRIQEASLQQRRHALLPEGARDSTSASGASAECAKKGETAAQAPLLQTQPDTLSASSVAECGAEPCTFIQWKFGERIPAPGKLLTDLCLFLGDTFTDTYAWSSFMRKGHVLFAGVLAAFSWTSTFIQLRSGLMERVLDIAVDSSRAGVPTADWIHIMDTEKGMEALVSFLVQGYGFFFAGFSYPDIIFNHVSIALSFFGLASYLQDKCDLHLPLEPDTLAASSQGGSAAASENDTPHAVFAWLVTFFETAVMSVVVGWPYGIVVFLIYERSHS